MNPSQALWEKGGFSAIAAFMRQSGDAPQVDHRIRNGGRGARS